MTRLAKPWKLRTITDKDWNNLTLEQQQRALGSVGITKAQVDTEPDSTVLSTTPDFKLKLTNIRDWNEEVDGVSGERLRDCIIYQLDVRKRKFWIDNMVPSTIRRKAKELDEETPPNWHPPEADPLLVEKQQKTSDGEVTIRYLRDPRSSEERKFIREKFGINSYTLKRLAKKDCGICKGTGYRDVSQYPDHPQWKLLEETYVCDCVFE